MKKSLVPASLLLVFVPIFLIVGRLWWSYEPGASEAQHRSTRDELVSLVWSHGPQKALERYHELLRTDLDTQKSCHELAHILGHETYVRSGSFAIAMKFQDDVCGSGFAHGVVEGYFADKREEALGEYLSICPAMDGVCIHGIGHGLMFAHDNDVFTSITLCARFSDPFERTACAEGVFMENFETKEDIHHSLYLRASEPFYPCDQMTGIYKEACAFYSGRYHLRISGDDAGHALSACSQTSLAYACVKGIGSALARKYPHAFEELEKACLLAKPDLRSICIAGGLRYYSLITYVQDMEATKSQVCPTFTDPAMRTLCLGA